MRGKELSNLLVERGLLTGVTKSVQIKRLEEDDRSHGGPRASEQIAGVVHEVRDKVAAAKLEHEQETGHPSTHI